MEKAKERSMRAGSQIIARFIVDTEKDKILFVPAEVNHPEFLAEMLGKSIRELKENPKKAGHFVGAAARIEGQMVIEVIIGISGIEMVFNPKDKPLHTKKQVNKARNLILATLQAGNYLKKGFKLRMIYR